MFKKLINFIKYNNAMVLILAIIFIVGTGVFAQTDAGQALIGEKQTNIEGVDNTLLLEADLDVFNMDFKIEKIEQDEKYYYVIYTYLDLVNTGDAWDYQLMEKTRKVSKKADVDLGEYLAEELSEEYLARIKQLKNEQDEALDTGEEVRQEVTEYSGLIGQTLEAASKVFSGYEPVKKRPLPSPSIPPTVLMGAGTEDTEAVPADNLTDVYFNYVIENDPDEDNVFGILDNCPDDANPDQLDADEDGIGDVCDPIDDSSSSSEQADNSTATSGEENINEDTATGTPEEITSKEESAAEEEVAEETVEEETVGEPDVVIIEESDGEEALQEENAE